MKKEDITLEDIRRRLTKTRDVYCAHSLSDDEIMQEARQIYKELQEQISLEMWVRRGRDGPV